MARPWLRLVRFGRAQIAPHTPPAKAGGYLTTEHPTLPCRAVNQDDGRPTPDAVVGDGCPIFGLDRWHTHTSILMTAARIS
jgi:hypothetical protein